MKKLFALFSFFLFVFCFDHTARGDERLAAKIRELIEAPRFAHAHWGMLFVDRHTNETIFELNSNRLFAPASVTKLYSVACAFDALGPGYRFETPVLRRGTVDPLGILQGDLILIASGDLSFGGRTLPSGEIAFTNGDHTYANGVNETSLTEPDPLAGLQELAKQVAASGIRRITGDVRIDDRLFEKATGTGSGPSRLTPIMVNDNLLDFTIEPTASGQPAKVTWRPRTAAFQIETKFVTVGKNGSLETWIHENGHGRLLVHGKIPEGHRSVLRVYEVPDAAAFARTLFIEALEQQGVVCEFKRAPQGPVAPLPPKETLRDLPVVAKLVSPPFSESARLILKVSHNLHASTLPLLVAVKHGQRTLADGLHRQHDFLKRIGVNADSISFGGGAGGDRADYVTPHATVQLLKAMTARGDFQTYLRALPTLGVDGTLYKSVDQDSPARGKVFAKTGTLTSANTMNSRTLLKSKALAGYMTTASGRSVVFAAFVNHVHLTDGLTANSIGRDLGRLCEIVHESK